MAWRLADEKNLYLDQFSGKRIALSDTSTYGALGQATELGVLTHMGTQFGVVDRIVMTGGVLLMLTSIFSSLVMWWKRRPKNSAGMPKRPDKPRLPVAVGLICLAIGVVYPLWGASALLVLVLDRLVIQRLRVLRRTFGMPTS